MDKQNQPLMTFNHFFQTVWRRTSLCYLIFPVLQCVGALSTMCLCVSPWPMLTGPTTPASSASRSWLISWLILTLASTPCCMQRCQETSGLASDRSVYPNYIQSRACALQSYMIKGGDTRTTEILVDRRNVVPSRLCCTDLNLCTT